VLHRHSLALLQALEQESFSPGFLKELIGYRQRLEQNPNDSSWFGCQMSIRLICGVNLVDR
jgi:hypothetical protein